MQRVGTIEDTFAYWFDMFILGHTPYPCMMTSVLTCTHAISLRDVWHRCLDILHTQLGFFIQQNAFEAYPRLDSSIFIDLVLVYTGAYPMHCHVCVFKWMMVFRDAFS